MKYGVIDVGSNSVRLMISDGVKTLSKNTCTTRLAEGMMQGNLADVSIERTALAVKDFYHLARLQNVSKIWCFATAAVRQAKNKELFLDRVKELCGLEIEVISGETEAYLGLSGALSGCNGGIIDVGGASTEIAIIKNGQIIYSKSVDIGAVNLTDKCGQDFILANDFVRDKLCEYGTVGFADFYSIGGTATSIAAMLQELEPYDPTKTDGYVVSKSQMEILTQKLYSMTVAEREKIKGLQVSRAKVIANGVLIMLKVMDYIGLQCFTVSEKDNLEGYLTKKLEQQ